MSPPKVILTAAQLDEMVRLGLIDSPQEVTRKLLEDEKEDRDSAGDTDRGRRQRLAGKRGGRPRGSKKAAQVLAEFNKRRPKTSMSVSDSALATKIGAEVGLGKRAAIAAINLAKKLRRKPV